jgi:hypothetical protein
MAQPIRGVPADAQAAVNRVAAAARSLVRPESTVAGIGERLLLGALLDLHAAYLLFA